MVTFRYAVRTKIIPFHGTSGRIYRFTARQNFLDHPEEPGIYVISLDQSRRGRQFDVLEIGRADDAVSRSLKHTQMARSLRENSDVLFAFLPVSAELARSRVFGDLDYIEGELQASA